MFQFIFYALQGIWFGIRNERNFKIHCFGLLFMIFTAYYFHFTKLEWVVCILSATLVLSLELVNTSIEKSLDLLHPQKHPLVKIAKDCAAGSVLIASTAALIIWIMIMLDKF
jgi:undecaprenol kinase/diacylglycerol kinase (ATP)